MPGIGAKPGNREAMTPTIVINVARGFDAGILQQMASRWGALWQSLEADRASEDVIDVEVLPIANAYLRDDVPEEPSLRDARERPGTRLLDDARHPPSLKQTRASLLGCHVDVYA
jgi:hypothetical protein